MAVNSIGQDDGILKVVVIGAGLAGLLASIGLRLDGHHVVILEQATSFGEVGAGMRIPPNSFKVLNRWGIDLTYMKKTYSNGNRFLRYTDGEVLADMAHGVPEWSFGGSYLMIHRADYHAVLLEKAQSLGVEIKSNHKVERYEWATQTAITADGARFSGDLLIVADGVQSKARPEFQGHELPPTDTGDAVYRMLLPGQDLLADPELRDLISQPWVNSWCGPGAHVIGYPVRGGEIYNIVYCCSVKTMQDEAFQSGVSKMAVDNNTELRRRFADWEPRVRKLVELAGNEIMKWQLFDLDLVDNWVHPTGNAVLIGDSVHPMLPYMASGAAMACEDAAALRTALKGVSKSSLRDALFRYQKARQPRASAVQKAGRQLQHAYHLEDGEEQRERDFWIKQDHENNPIFWGDLSRKSWLYGHDAEDISEAA